MCCFNIFVFARFAAIRGLPGANALGTSKCFWAVAVGFLVVYNFVPSNGLGPHTNSMQLEGDKYSRLASIVFEAFFVLIYLAGSESELGMRGINRLRYWVYLVFLLHPLIWRTLIIKAGYYILIPSILPFIGLAIFTRSREGSFNYIKVDVDVVDAVGSFGKEDAE